MLPRYDRPRLLEQVVEVDAVPVAGDERVGRVVDPVAARPLEEVARRELAHAGEDAALFDTVEAVAMDFCRALDLSIPVGKDSMSMSTVWEDREKQKRVTAPISLIVSAFAPVADVRASLTPQLRTDAGATRLILIDVS